MSEQIEKLRAVVRELEKELHELDDVDEQSSEVLQEALQEIQAVLRLRQREVQAVEAGERPAEQIPPQTSRSLMDQLKQSAREFEGSHPTVSGILIRLIDGLGQMGI